MRRNIIATTALKKIQANTEEIFYCKHTKCKMRLFILFNKEYVSVSVWRTVNEHEHDESDKKEIRINAITKNQIKRNTRRYRQSTDNAIDDGFI